MAYRSKQKVGVLGGGQLGRMLIQAAIDLDVYLKVIDPDAEAPCKYLAHEFVHGDFKDFQTVLDFGRECEIITIEIENVNLEALEELEKLGKKVFPQPHILRQIKNKGIQKQFYKKNNIPTAHFELTEGAEAVKAKLIPLPFVNKLAEGGYDGRGVQMMRKESDLAKAFSKPSLVEALVDFEKELAVIVARSAKGEIKSFPVVEMVFHPEANLVEYLFAPAKISREIEGQAKALAEKTAETFGIVGLLAVEMFLDKKGQILVNEVAPRPHNSGHHTLKANFVSQFEQHLRAILGLPLGDTQAIAPAAMVNLLGEEGHTGVAQYQGMADCLALSGVFPFLYGKAMTQPYRKMGHVSLIDPDFEKLEEKVNFVKNMLKVTAKKQD